MKKNVILPLVALSLLVILAGCSGRKASGTWKSSVGPVNFTLVLNSDGTGTLSSGGNDNIKWEEDGNTVKMYPGDTKDTKSAAPGATGLLSDDGKTMSVSGGQVPLSLTFTKQP